MFDGVGRDTDSSARRQGTAFLMSTASVAAMFLFLFWVTSKVKEEIANQEELLEVPVSLVAPPPPPPPPAGGQKKPKTEKKKEEIKPVQEDVPVEVKPLEEPPVTEEVISEDEGEEGGVEGGQTGGVVGGVVGGKEGGVIGGTNMDAPAVSTVYFRDVQVKTQPPKPEYPEAARQMRIEDRCVIRIKIDEEGTPYEAEVRTCPEVFRAVSLASARASRFYPYLVGGKAARVQFDWTFNFKLQ